MAKVLVVDDDEKLADTILEVLTRGGLIVDLALNAEEAEPMLDGFTYDLLILDWMMPGMHGIDFLAKMRGKGLKTPVLMLTGMDSVDNKIAGLDNGADDYLTKPFNSKELLARARAMLRRPLLVESEVLNFSGVTLESKTQKVSWQGNEIKLTKQEFQLLELLMRHKNEVFSHDALVARAWSSMSESSADTVRVHMSRLRKKFETGAGECPLQTVHGIGYVFVAD